MTAASPAEVDCWAVFAHALRQLRRDMRGPHPGRAHMAARTVVQFVCTCVRERVGPFAGLLASGGDDLLSADDTPIAGLPVG